MTNQVVNLEWNGNGINSNNFCIIHLKDISTKNKIETYLKNLLSRTNIPKVEGIIYTGKQCNIPRNKIKEFINQNNLKKTSCFDYSNVVAVDRDLIERLYKVISGDDIIDGFFIEFNENDRSIVDLIKSMTKYSIEQSTFDKENFRIYVPNVRKHNFYSNFIDVTFPSPPQFSQFISLYRERNIVDLFEIISYLVDRPQIEIIFDDEFLPLINQDGLDLNSNSNYIETIENMFDSGDVSNIKLALDMLSHVNLESSTIEIALILNKNKNIFYWGRGISTQNNPGMKVIVKYFQNKKIFWKGDWRSFIDSVYNRYPEKQSLLAQYALKNYNLELERFNNKFRIKSLELMEV